MFNGVYTCRIYGQRASREYGDLNAGVYGIKIDGADVDADIPLLNAASEIAHYATSTYGWDQGTFHVDNIRIAGPKQETQKVAVTDIAVAGVNGVSTIASLGGTLRMLASVAPDNATDKSVNWTVVAENGEATHAATIDKNGMLTALADGKVKVVATAKDGSGVHGESVVTIDSTPPAIATPSKLTFLQTEPVLVNFSATDNVSGLQSLVVTFNGQTSAGPISLDPLALNVGTYPIVVTATDNAGHQSTAQFSLVITIDIGHLDDLIAYGFDQGWIDDGGTQSSLMSHVNQIQRDQGDDKKLQNSINSMENNLRTKRQAYRRTACGHHSRGSGIYQKFDRQLMRSKQSPENRVFVISIHLKPIQPPQRLSSVILCFQTAGKIHRVGLYNFYAKV